jgi:hypothetical protein
MIGRGVNLSRFYTSTNQPIVNRNYRFGSAKSLVGVAIGKKTSRRDEKTLARFKFEIE